MSFRDCIDNAEAEGSITPDQAQKARALYDNSLSKKTGKMSDAQAEAESGREAFESLDYQTIEKRRQQALRIAAQSKLDKLQKNHVDLRGRNNPIEAAESTMGRIVTSDFISAETRYESVRKRAHSLLDNLLVKTRPNMIGGKRRKMDVDNFIMEMFGKKTGDAEAADLAKAAAEVLEYLRKRFNAAGGRIARLDNYGLPTRHNFLKVRKAGKEEWIKYLIDNDVIDRTRTVDNATGKAFTDEEFVDVLSEVWDTISTRGVNKLDPSGAIVGKALANRRTDHRFLHFKNPEAWIAYQQKFGDEDVIDSFFSHIDGMSRDISLLETFGPNPNASINFMKQNMDKLTVNTPLEDMTQGGKRKLQSLYDMFTGTSLSPSNPQFASMSSGVRDILTSAQLGSAMLSAAGDIGYQFLSRRMLGLPQIKFINGYIKQIASLDPEEAQKRAIRLGLGADNFIGMSVAMNRYVSESYGPEITRRLADGVLRSSGLNQFTQVGQWTAGQDLLSELASKADTPFKSLNKNMQQYFLRNGIDEKAWDVIRKTKQYEDGGVSFIRPSDVEARTDISPDVALDYATRVYSLVDELSSLAVPTYSLRGKYMLGGGEAPGSIKGELFKNMGMYKGFAVNVLLAYLPRVRAMGGYDAASFAFQYLAVTTAMGLFALQLKQIAAGREPREVDESVIGAALLQGGGLGFAGDLIFSNVNEYGRGMEDVVAGPVFGLGNDVINLSVGNLVQLASGEDTNVGRELVNFAKNYTPGSNLWYLRLAAERQIADRALLAVDPEARSYLRQKERKYEREFNQGYWWGRGESFPSM